MFGMNMNFNNNSGFDNSFGFNNNNNNQQQQESKKQEIVSFKTAHKKFLGVLADGSTKHYDGDEACDATSLTITFYGNNKVSLQNHKRSFITSNKNEKIVIGTTKEYWGLEKISDNQVAFVDPYGKYLGCNKNGGLYTVGHCQAWEHFTIKSANHSKLLKVVKGNGGALSFSGNAVVKKQQSNNQVNLGMNQMGNLMGGMMKMNQNMMNGMMNMGSQFDPKIKEDQNKMNTDMNKGINEMTQGMNQAGNMMGGMMNMMGGMMGGLNSMNNNMMSNMSNMNANNMQNMNRVNTNNMQNMNRVNNMQSMNNMNNMNSMSSNMSSMNNNNTKFENKGFHESKQKKGEKSQKEAARRIKSALTKAWKKDQVDTLDKQLKKENMMYTAKIACDILSSLWSDNQEEAGKMLRYWCCDKVSKYETECKRKLFSSAFNKLKKAGVFSN